MEEKTSINTKRLATAVVLQAMQDIIRPNACRRDERAKLTESACAFLFEEEFAPDLEIWCKVAEVSVNYIRERAKFVLNNTIDLFKLEDELVNNHRLTLSQSDEEETIH